MTNFTDGVKKLSTAVILQAVKDYKKNYKDSEKSRASIEKWVRDGNIFCDIMLPDLSADDIIRGLRNGKA